MTIDNLAHQYQGGKGQIVGKIFRGKIEGRTLDYRVAGVEFNKGFFDFLGKGKFEVVHAKIVGNNIPDSVRRVRFLGGDSAEDFDYTFPLANHQNDLHVTEAYAPRTQATSEH